MPNKTKQNPTVSLTRPPVVAIMGHIDHGKSTLLDYIRKSHIVDRESGGITQHLGAYEVTCLDEKKVPRTITFLDTPGHAAFSGIRTRSAQVADIAILIVSGEEGVKPQTTEALKQIKEAKVPFIVAITKIDSPKCDVERTKQSLAENEIYIEGYGGDVSCAPLSAKTGKGVPELLEIILLTADVAELTANPSAPAQGVIIEAHRDPRRGIAATVLIKDGTLKGGTWAVSGESIAPVRFIENDLGKQIPSATFSAPVRVIGWSVIPEVGATVLAYSNRKEAEAAVTTKVQKRFDNTSQQKPAEEKLAIPVIIKADAGGSVEAIVNEFAKLTHDRAGFSIIESSVGAITENDIRLASTHPGSIVFGFHVDIGKPQVEMAERNEIPVLRFDIIYKLTEEAEKILKERAPKLSVEETSGKAKIQKIFSINKDKQIVGGKVETGTITTGSTIRILRRDAEVGRGKIRGLEQGKLKATEVAAGREFGTLIEAKIEIAPGDYIESFTTSEK